MLDNSFYTKTDEILSKYPAQERSLIPIIHEIQETWNYIPVELLSYIAGKIGITETKAYSVASFYEIFSFDAKGKYIIRFCDGTSCHVRQSVPVLNRLREKGLAVGGNYGTLAGKVFRVGHMGSQADDVLVEKGMSIIQSVLL